CSSLGWNKDHFNVW
nr:immunoglobulin heavy chain junction region [Macaca mulatta]MOV59587.1 immunoglobulin heavy chain junction region [Macaca mulatta]